MPAVRVAFVANARSGSADRVAEVERLLRDAGAEVVETDFEEVCRDPARAAAALRGAGRVVVSGGDGSVGPAARLALEAGLPLAVVPAGTANSFARWLDLPLDLEDAARLATTGEGRRRVEVADAAGRPFVNVAATGLSVLAAHRARPLKRSLGPLAYAVGAARAAAAGRPLHVAVSTDGREAWRGDAWQVLVAATGAFGGDSSTGGVDTEDHRLDVAIVEAGPRLALARRAWAMRRGRLVADDEVVHVRGRVVGLEVGDHARFNIDGEVLDPRPRRFSILGTIEVVTG